VKEPTNSLAINDTVAFTAGTTGTLPANVTAGRNYTVSSPGAGTFQFKDGVNTVTPNANGTGFAWGSSWNNRVAAIKKTLGKTPDNVSLIYHTGSPLVKSEIQLWTGGGDSGAWPKVTGFFDNGPGGAAIPFSSKRGFANAFNSITTDVIVISADPHFQENKDDLIQAANQSSKIVCYPYADYRNRGGTHKPRPGMSYLYGPSLKDMIDQMGTIAGTFGKNNPAPPYAPLFTPVTDGYGANLRQL